MVFIELALADLLRILTARYLSAPRYLPTQIPYAGVLLEIFGFILVAVGIRETRKLFNQPSLIENIDQWFKLVAERARSIRTMLPADGA